VCEDWQMCLLINYVDGDSVSCLHQGIQVCAGRMHFHPPRMVARCRSIKAADQLQSTIAILLMCPQLVRTQICRVEICLGWIKDHSVNAGVRLIFVILDVLLDGATGIDCEDVAVQGVVVECVSIDAVWWLLRS